MWFRSLGLAIHVVTSLMTIVVVTIFASYAIYAWERREHARPVPALVDISNDLFVAVQNFRLERGIVNTALVTPEIAGHKAIDDILTVRSRSEKALGQALTKLDAVPLPDLAPYLRDIFDTNEEFVAMRSAVDAAMLRPRDQRPGKLSQDWISTNGKFANTIDRLSVRLDSAISEADASIAKMVQLKETVWSSRSSAGNDRLYVAEAIARRERLSDAQLEYLALLAGQVDGSWKVVEDQTHRPDTPLKLQAAVQAADTLYFGKLRDTRKAIIDNLAAGGPSPVSADEWLDLSAAAQTSMFMVAVSALDIAGAAAGKQFDDARRNFFGALVLIVVFSGLGVLNTLYVSKRVVGPVKEVTEATSCVAAGDFERRIPFEWRTDEIGSLARALRVFRDSAVAKEALRVEKERALAELAAAHNNLEAKIVERTHALRAEIANRERVERGLRESEERYRSLTANVPGIVYQRVRHTDGRIDFPLVSEGIREMLGLEPVAVMANPSLMLDCMHEEDRERYQSALARSAVTLLPFDIEFRHVHRNGSVRWIHTVSRPRRRDDGAIVWDGIGFDTTERHETERALREHKDRIHAITANLPGFLFQCRITPDDHIGFSVIRTPDFDFRCGNAGDAAGHEQGVLEFVHPEDRAKLKESIHNAHDKATGWNQTVRIKTPSGLERWVHATASLRDSASGERVWDGIALDETDRIATAEENSQLQSKLRQAEKLEAIGTLAGGVAHELNNLLQPIIMMTELTLSELPEGSRHGSQLQRVIDAGGKAAEIVQRILAFGRADEPSHHSLDMSSATREAIAFVRTILPTSITLRADIDDHVGKVRGDKTQLTQVLINMATNARDAIGANVGTVWISLSSLDVGSKTPLPRVGTLAKGRYALVTVRDSGVGMDAATMQRIFEPFFTTKDVGKGTGLGLSVTHGIIVGHGGAINVDSAPGRGTSFSIYLPLEEVELPIALTA